MTRVLHGTAQRHGWVYRAYKSESKKSLDRNFMAPDGTRMRGWSSVRDWHYEHWRNFPKREVDEDVDEVDEEEEAEPRPIRCRIPIDELTPSVGPLPSSVASWTPE